MTTEEAKKVLEEQLKYALFTDTTSTMIPNDVVELAIDGIEKQIPKKPVIIVHWHLCPKCYETYGFSYDILVGMRGLKTNECHCLNCGQVIDLGGEDDRNRDESI